MSDSGGTQQPWSPGGQPPQTPGWGQPGAAAPPPGYGAPQPGPPPGGYSPPSGANPSWGGGPTPPAPPAPKAKKPASGIKLEMMSYPWLLAGAAILVAFALVALGDIIEAFEKGLPGRLRVRTFFDFGNLELALLLLLGVALVVLTPKVLGDKTEGTPTRPMVIDGLLVASLAVGVAAVVDIIMDFTLFGDAFSLSLGDLLTRLAAIAVAGATAYWALANRSKTSKTVGAAPPPPPWGPAGGSPGGPPAPPTTGFQPGGQYPQPQQGGYPPPGGYPPSS